MKVIKSLHLLPMPIKINVRLYLHLITSLVQHTVSIMVIIIGRSPCMYISCGSYSSSLETLVNKIEVAKRFMISHYPHSYKHTVQAVPQECIINTSGCYHCKN